ncbi:hypothetical protein HYH03_011426 [Edaphochlamys debaryana]|uniref:Pherophorin domain-containing protein n=1 Tax=Edaphochlamys debaryana TaxID=47281 RepID=A0A836BV65_9CHLO|nr:hypothetical protein HYH03_011426 [Edaphochlamys debaryana]|eukprot:KAG2490120.1 hypothetical protein HYH03_011426 [Edaphochlamys debaryana]
MRAPALLALLLGAALAGSAFALETFPPYQCVRDPDQSRFRLDVPYTFANKRVCLTSRVVACNKPKSPCCDRKVDLAKIELDISPLCKFAIKDVTVNGRPALVPTFNSYNDGLNGVMKLTGLNLTVANAEGAQICFSLGGPAAAVSAAAESAAAESAAAQPAAAQPKAAQPKAPEPKAPEPKAAVATAPLASSSQP